MKRISDAVIAGAIYDFAGYLTTREDFQVGEHSDCSAMVQHVTDFLKARDIDSRKADVATWNRRCVSSNTTKKIFLRNRK